MQDETQSCGMKFGEAQEAMAEGKKVARHGWNGEGMWIEDQVPDEHSKMTLPYYYIKTAQGDLVPWTISQSDAHASDWYVVENEQG